MSVFLNSYLKIFIFCHLSLKYHFLFSGSSKHTGCSRGLCEDKKKQLKKLEMEHCGCAEKLRASQELATNYMKSANEVQRELDYFAMKVHGMEQKVAEETNKTITQATMKARVETMLEYHRGEWSTWDVAEKVYIYNDTYPDDAFQMDDLGGDDVGHGLPKDDAPGDNQ